ncbi:MAG: ZIP family metal transporter [Leptotrichiaceae bacterium]|nr:ZIP family metal transporter [Leptotrichiaceae bacterium]
MVSFFYNLSPIVQALIGTLFTWGVTALGASLVFFFKTINKKMLNAMLGFAAGVMVAASFWSLLNPAIILSEELGHISWLTVSVGFLSGGFFIFLIDKLLPHLHLGLKTDNAEGIKTSWQRSILLVLSITLHNIPEGLAVGVSFGAAAFGIPGASVTSAVALAIGIGLQNFPEGAAVSIPLRREGFSRKKAFFYGQASGIVEPIAGVLGVIGVVSMRNFLPFALAFAAGAMIFVVVEELIPEAQLNEGETSKSKSADIATIGFMIGFTIMMVLDVALG